MRRTVEHFGRLDILFNNAGLMLLGSVTNADVDDWERMIAVNLTRDAGRSKAHRSTVGCRPCPKDREMPWYLSVLDQVEHGRRLVERRADRVAVNTA